MEKKKGKERVKAYFCKVPFSLKQVAKDAVFNGVISPESRWCYVEELDAKQAMRKVNKNHSMYLSWARKLQKELLSKFTKEKQYKKIIEQLELNKSETVSSEVVVL